jgi:serine O-acetyltransferase
MFIFWLIRHRLHLAGFVRLAKVLTQIGQMVTGAYIPAECEIGRGTKFSYGGAGLVLNRLTKVGRNCVLSPGVLLGSGQGRSLLPGAPVLEDDVRVYQNAAIIGGVRVGRGAVINVNAVVLHDIPPGGVVNAARSEDRQLRPKAT